MTLAERKEKFLIDYILARASFKEAIDPLLSLQDAEAVWNKIQKLKYA
jgi:hypothetical protein